MQKIPFTEDLAKHFQKSVHFQNLNRTFKKLFGDFLCFITEGPEKLAQDLENLRKKGCKSCNLSQGEREACKMQVIEALKRGAKTRKIQRFPCQSGRNGFCYPISQGRKIYGYVVACQIDHIPSDNTLAIFEAFVQTVLSDVQKQLELRKLYETIRPRAIALSTVHTLHRLISSTLNLNELLPRIARLTLQVMRATRCSIKLVDAKRKTLLPKTTIDLHTKNAKLKKVQIGRWAPGKAVKYMRPIRGKDYLATPLIDEDVIGVITVYNKLDKKPFTDFDEEIMKTLCEQAVIAIKNAQLYKEQERLTIGSIKSIAAILETKAPGTFLPRASFLKIVNLIGQELKLDEYGLKCLQYATLLHDAGQITLPDKLTKKKGILTGDEYKLIKEHPKKAAIILKPLKSLKNVVPIILHHHESYDGTGYPMGLKGNEIPLGARIMGVVGAFEAMITEKPYRKPIAMNAAIEEIKKNAGKQFDPVVVKAFFAVIGRKGILKMVKKEIYGSRKARK